MKREGVSVTTTSTAEYIRHTCFDFNQPITVWYFINVFHDANSATSLLRKGEVFGKTSQSALTSVSDGG